MQSISRVSGFLETARDLTLEASRNAGTRNAVSYSGSRVPPAQQIKKMLDSRNERDVLDALRRIISMQYANPPQPTLTYFPAVLKTLSNPYPSTRPLVYNYLLHNAESDPDTALLSINTIQKSLNDSNPRIRAMALKTMSGIRIPMISQIISLAIKKGVADLSPLVRKTAALACVKCVRLDPSTQPQVEEYITALLNDQQYYVTGAAVQAFMEICPDRLDLIHPVYRKLCRMVVDIDEWGQLAFLKLMIVYARRCFPTRTKSVRRKAQSEEQRAKDFYEDIDAAQEIEEDFEHVQFVDPDLDLLLKSVQPLLYSRNSAVLVAVARLYLHLSPESYLGEAVGPLVALLRSPDDTRQVALYNIVQTCLIDPALFVPYFRHFLIRASDTPQIASLKIETLTLVFPYADKEVQDLILAELEHFSQGHNPSLVKESVGAIGRCAQFSNARTSQRCLTLLLKQIHSTDQNLVGEAIEVVRHLIQRAPADHTKTVIRLAKNLDTLTSPTARASVIWLVGEFAGNGGDQDIAADVLRILVKGYVEETDEVRAQIVLLAAKVYLQHLNSDNAKQKAIDALNPSSNEHKEDDGRHQALSPELEEGGFADDGFSSHQQDSQDPNPPSMESPNPIALLYNHTMLLARYTSSYGLRDRARMFRALLAVPSSTELASLLLLAPKPVPQAPSPSESRKKFTLGSASLVIGVEAGLKGLKGYEAVPDWVVEGHEPDPALRDEKEGRSVRNPSAGGVNAYVPPSMSGSAGKSEAAGKMLDQALEKDPGYKSGKMRKEKDLNAWLDDDDDDEDEDDGDDDEESDEEDEESDEESEEETGSEDEEDEEDESSESETESEDDEKAGLVK